MKCKKLFLKILIISIFIIPLNVLGYAHYVIPGGETIGIEVNSKGILVVGFYKVNDKLIGKDAGFRIGDIITKVNDNNVSTINEMVTLLNNSKEKVKFNILRQNKNITITTSLEKDSENILKTGLYIKDKITGIGTLSYIDVSNTNNYTFASLGHEIIDSTTASKFEIKDGKIYEANVESIEKSRAGEAGEKNTTYDKNEVYGIIKNNEITGIYGDYTSKVEKNNLIEVGEIDDITTGKATILTVIKDNTVEEFEIDIISLDKESKTKNILFTITDQNLLNATGGIVQGMSGSPIIQNNKIIGAVNYVIVNDTSKGYGIFITTMLKENEKAT